MERSAEGCGGVQRIESPPFWLRVFHFTLLLSFTSSSFSSVLVLVLLLLFSLVLLLFSLALFVFVTFSSGLWRSFLLWCAVDPHPPA